MISLPSFAKINLGLKIGPRRADGFHELRTVYQTLALHDVIRVEALPGAGIEIRCDDPRVPCDESNTCYKAAERVLAAIPQAEHSASAGKSQIPRLRPSGSARDDNQNEGPPIGAAEAAPLRPHVAVLRDHGPLRRHTSQEHGKIIIEIDKRLPVQGGMGAASSNAVTTMLGMERALGIELAPAEKLRIAAEVGSDLPLFLMGGTVLGVGRGEEVYPLPDLPVVSVVVITPAVGVSTPKAFARWDEIVAPGAGAPEVGTARWDAALTASGAAGTISEFGERVFTWLGNKFPQALGPASGVPAAGGDRAETPLLDLVRAGIENDFERVVFPEYPELREVKELLLRGGAQHASLSGSGSTVYGLFASAAEAQQAAERMSAAGHTAVATTTLTRAEYWQAFR